MGRRKKSPNKIRQRAPPKGSSITPRRPSSRYTEEAPKIVSEPNQVAKRAEADKNKGRDLPASTKSFEFLTNLDDQAPIARVRTK
jgi:hypothetical protein